MFNKLIASAILGMVLSACASVGSDIKTETLVDPKVNMDGFKSYAWVEGLAVVQDDTGQWSEPGFDINAEIRFLIDKEMQERGRRFADASADLLVSYLLIVNMDAQQDELQERYGADVDLTNLHEGGLVIVLVDPESQKAVWAGIATAQLRKEPTDEDAKKRLGIAVHKIFADFEG